MYCVKKTIYVLKYMFCLKNIYWVKLALWDIIYFLNGGGTVSLTMLIRLSHESLDVCSFSAESESHSFSDAVVRD